MNDTLAHFIAHAEHNAHHLTELVWEAAHHACARLTHDLPEAIAHELSELHLEETLKLLRSSPREQILYLAKTLGEAEAARRLTLAFESSTCTAA
ncbi:MAG: hypothetical protein ABWU16_08550 [Halothiobacillaceae bacterium]